MDTLGKKIKFIRDKLGLNQSQLAKELGLESAMAISKYESDQREPDISKLIKLSEIGGVSLDWLLTGEGEMTRQSEKEPLQVGEEPAIYNVSEDIIKKITIMLKDMDKEAQREALKYLQEKKLLKELLNERLKKEGA